jgi:hippurate hydrolase
MGTFRAMNEEWRFKAHGLIKQHVTEIAKAMGAEATIHIDVGYPTVDNDEKFTNAAKEKAIDFLGNAHVSETEMRMGAEDFGYYTQKIPGCFFRLGVRNEEEGIIHNVHTPKFNIDEKAIEKGVSTMAWLGATLGF